MMKVKELIIALSKLEPDAPIIATWEGTLNTITEAAISVGRDKSGRPVVVIDVDASDYPPKTERIYTLEDAYDKPVRTSESPAS